MSFHLQRPLSLIANNRFEGCGIGIHFTAGSERNMLTGNAFIGNGEQVKYVGTRFMGGASRTTATSGPTTPPST